VPDALLPPNGHPHSHFGGPSAFLRVVSCTLLALALPSSALAGKIDTVQRLIADAKLETAQIKCDKWQAHMMESDEEQPIREVCAEAWWPVSEATDTEQSWSDFRAKWQGTTWDLRAKEKGAAAAFRDLDKQSTEADIKMLADRYASTSIAPSLLAAVADAAVRDATDGADALRIVETWPNHEGVPGLVERFPKQFLRVAVKGREVKVTTEPPIALSGALTPKVRWVVRDAAGAQQDWDVAAGGWLAEWGVPATVTAARPVPTDGAPSLPLCSVPGLPSGVGPGVEVSVGGGRLLHPLSWGKGCGPADWPAFLSLTDGDLRGISLRPGHFVDLTSEADKSGRKNIRGHLGQPAGIPQLHNGVVLEQLGPAWIASPVNGGMPWATAMPPSARSLPLTDTLKSAPTPAGWSIKSVNGEMQATGTALAKMPPQMRTWTFPGTEARIVPQMVRGTFGLMVGNASGPTPSAPILGPAAGWKRTPEGSMLREPPVGAVIAGIRQVQGDAIETALGVAAGVGLSRDRIVPLDAWAVDVDGDRIAETIIRAKIDGKGGIIVVDPLEGKEAYTADKARVFAFSEPMVLADRRTADLPFAFRKGKFVYMAWGASEVLGATQRRHTLVVVRSDGAGVLSESWELPAK